MNHLRLLARASLFAGISACALGCETYETPPEAPPAVTLNFYGYRGSAPEVRTVPAPSVEAAPSTTGNPACDEYFARVRSCIGRITSNTQAIARFDRSVDVSMRDDAIVAASGDPHARQQLTARCEAALTAYQRAPCDSP